MADIYDYNSHEDDDLARPQAKSSPAVTKAGTLVGHPLISRKRKRRNKIDAYQTPRRSSPVPPNLSSRGDHAVSVSSSHIPNLDHLMRTAEDKDPDQCSAIDGGSASRGMTPSHETLQFQNQLLQEIEAAHIEATLQTAEEEVKKTQSSQQRPFSEDLSLVRSLRSRKVVPLCPPLGSTKKVRPSIPSQTQSAAKLMTRSNTRSGTKKVQVQNADGNDDLDVLATPTGPPIMKKVIIDEYQESDEDVAAESPSKKTSYRRSMRLESDDIGHNVSVHNHHAPSLLPDGTESRESSPSFTRPQLVTPGKSRVILLQQTTPTKCSRSTPKQTPSKASPKKKSKTPLPDLKVDQDLILVMKDHVLRKLTGRTTLPLINRGNQYAAVHDLLRETILRSESNSALLLGPPQTGKSLVVETALESFREAGEEFFVMRLDGKIHTDDRSALRAIARQLQRKFSFTREVYLGSC